MSACIAGDYQQGPVLVLMPSAGVQEHLDEVDTGKDFLAVVKVSWA